MPQPLKTDAMRQRRNKAATRATLPAAGSPELEYARKAAWFRGKAPRLPMRERGDNWSPKVLDWWHRLWESPMSLEYQEAHLLDLYALADMWDAYWKTAAKDVRTRAVLLAEIRQQGVRFGTSPIDLRRLQWEVEKGEEAATKTAGRKAATRADDMRPAEGTDPRDLLRAVK